MSELTTALKTPREQLPDRIAQLMADLKAAERKIAQFESGALAQRIPALLENARTLGSTRVVAEHVGSVGSSDDLRGLVTTVRERLGSDASVVALAADIQGKPAVIVATNEASRASGAKAGALAKIAAGVLGGGGGGKDDIAQGGGSDVCRDPGCTRRRGRSGFGVGMDSGSMRTGVRLGVDVGRARIGVARCDRDGILATPVETVARGAGDLARIVALREEYDAVEIVVGLPLSLSGGSTASTEDARAFAAAIARVGATPVRLVDERLSTVTAQSQLRDNGRSTRSSRSVVDQVAAVIILQTALDSERSAGSPPGVLVDPDEGLT